MCLRDSERMLLKSPQISEDRSSIKYSQRDLTKISGVELTQRTVIFYSGHIKGHVLFKILRTYSGRYLPVDVRMYVAYIFARPFVKPD